MPTTHRPPPNTHRPTRPRRVAIDLVPIRVGEGGTGSGIWTYARELIRHMDQLELNGLEIVCLVNAGQLPYLSGLNRVKLVKFPAFGKNIVLRLLWIHLFLPLVCLFRRFDVLHKLATETPLFCPSKRITTVCDFYYEYLLENRSAERIRFYERLEKFYFSIITKICFRKSRAIIAISNATRQEGICRYPDAEEKICAIQLSAAPACPLPPHSSGTFTILCVAKFMAHKGQHLLIHAFEEMLGAMPELIGSVRLVLRGFHNDADYYQGICVAVNESRFSRDIKILDFNPSDSLSEIYKEADLVVLLSSYEGFGLPVLEAQGMGIPVLCSDLPVLREVGGNGAVYVDRENIQAVAERLARFVSDQEFCREMKTFGLENTKRFRWERAAMETIRCYEEVFR